MAVGYVLGILLFSSLMGHDVVERGFWLGADFDFLFTPFYNRHRGAHQYRARVVFFVDFWDLSVLKRAAEGRFHEMLVCFVSGNRQGYFYHMHVDLLFLHHRNINMVKDGDKQMLDINAFLAYLNTNVRAELFVVCDNPLESVLILEVQILLVVLSKNPGTVILLYHSNCCVRNNFIIICKKWRLVY